MSGKTKKLMGLGLQFCGYPVVMGMAAFSAYLGAEILSHHFSGYDSDVAATASCFGAPIALAICAFFNLCVIGCKKDSLPLSDGKSIAANFAVMSILAGIVGYNILKEQKMAVLVTGEKQAAASILGTLFVTGMGALGGAALKKYCGANFFEAPAEPADVDAEERMPLVETAASGDVVFGDIGGRQTELGM